MVPFLDKVLPSILFKTVYDKVFISKEARTAVGNSLESCAAHSEVLRILINDGCRNKKNNKQLTELSYTYLATLLKNVHSSYLLDPILSEGSDPSAR